MELLSVGVAGGLVREISRSFHFDNAVIKKIIIVCPSSTSSVRFERLLAEYVKWLVINKPIAVLLPTTVRVLSQTTIILNLIIFSYFFIDYVCNNG